MESPPTTACSETQLSRRYKGIRSSKKSLHSCTDFYVKMGGGGGGGGNDDGDTLGPRSLSLSALVPSEGGMMKKSSSNNHSASSTHSSSQLSTDPNRMSQLETLEAKMASIEVSLANVAAVAAQQAAHHGVPSASCSSLNAPPMMVRRTKRSLVGSARSQLSASSSSRTDLLLLHKEMENLRGSLKDKDNLILNLQGQLRKLSKRRTAHGSITSTDSGVLSLRVLSEAERKAAEERLASLDREMEQKRNDIHGINQRLGRLRPSDNIDTRIEQAELEYELEREELNLMNLAEERRNLHTILDDNDAAQKRNESSLFTSLPLNGSVALHAFEVVLENGDQSAFTVGKREDRAGTYVTWTRDDLKTLKRGDRIVEINGSCLISKGVNRLEEFWLDEDNNLSEDVELTAHPLRVVIMRAPPPPPPPRAPNRELHTIREELALVTAKLEQVVKEKRDAVALWNQLQGEMEPLLRCRSDAEQVGKERDLLRTEGVRLKHRISYLEEQVSEMIQEKAGCASVTVFQKGATRTIVGGSSGASDQGSGTRPPSAASTKNAPSESNNSHRVGGALRSRLWETFRRATSSDSRSVCSMDSSKAGTEAGYFSKKKGNKRSGHKDKDKGTVPSKPLRLSLQRATSSSEVYMGEEARPDLHPNLRRSSENTLLSGGNGGGDRKKGRSKAGGSGSSGGGGIRWPSLRPASSMSYAMPTSHAPHY